MEGLNFLNGSTPKTATKEPSPKISGISTQDPPPTADASSGHTKVKPSLTLAGGRIPHDCAICKESFRDPTVHRENPELWYSTFLTDAEAFKIAENHMNEIKLYHAKLGEIWKSKKAVVIGRWSTENSEGRVKLLNRAEPHLTTERQDAPLKAVLKPRGPSAKRHSQLRYRMGILLDFLSLDGLKENPARLIGLVNNRTFYAPHQWAVCDNQRLESCWSGGWLNSDYSPLCMRMKDPEFGKLVLWTAEAAHDKDVIGFPRAKLVLESQEMLLRSLYKIVEVLVTDAPATSVVPEQLNIEKVGHSKVWSAYRMLPFSQSPFFDCDELYEKAQTRLEQAKTHLGRLQTDVKYIDQMTVTSDRLDHEQTVRDIYYDIWNYWSWRHVLKACENIQMYPETLGEKGKYQAAVEELAQLLYMQVTDRSKFLRDLMSTRPSLSTEVVKYFHQPPEEKNFLPNRIEDTSTDLDSQPNYMEAFKQDSVIWLLAWIMSSPTSPEHTQLDHSLCFAMLDEQLVANDSDTKLLDKTLVDRLEDFATIHELWLMVHRHRPMPIPSRTLSQTDIPYPAKKIVNINRTDQTTIFDRHILRILLFRLQRPRLKECRMAAEALRKVLHAHKGHAMIPQSEEQKKVLLAQPEELKQTMREFWKVIRENRQADYAKATKERIGNEKLAAQIISQHERPRGLIVSVMFALKDWLGIPDRPPRPCAIDPDPQFSDDELELLSQNSSPEWERSMDSQTDERQKKSGTREQRQIHSQATTSAFPSSIHEQSANKFVSEPTIKKVKTVGSSTDDAKLEEDDTEDVEDGGDGEEKEQPNIQVKPSTYTMLSLMLNTDKQDARVTEINWIDFVSAMGDIGFSSAPAEGSRWQFAPGDALQKSRHWKGISSIHKPHGTRNKMQRTTLWKLGKDFKAKYDWDLSMFEEK